MNIHGNETQFIEIVPASNGLAQRPSSEDVLICGKCSYQCSDLTIFIAHKEQCKESPTSKLQSPQMVSAINGDQVAVQNLQNTFVNISLGSPHMVVQGPSGVTQLCKIIMDGSQTTFPELLTAEESIQLTSGVGGEFPTTEVNIPESGLKLDELHTLQPGHVLKEESVMPDDLTSWDKNSIEVGRSLSPQTTVITNQTEEEDVANFLANHMVAHKKPEHPKSDLISHQPQDQNSEDKTAKTRSRIGRKKQTQKESYISQISREEGQYLFCVFPECQFRTVHRKNIVRHFTKHSGAKPFECKECGKKFSRKDKLKIHERIHTGDRPYGCSEEGCTYRSIESRALINHVRTHSKEKPYHCQLCSYKCNDQSQLMVHLRFHTGDKPFYCGEEGCSSSFATSSDLKRHSYIHSGIKNFACSLCKYRTHLKHNLNTHIQVSHMENPRYSCSLCSFVGHTRRQYKEHQKIHKGQRCRGRPKVCRGEKMEKHFTCDICSSAFVRSDSFRSHMRQHQRHDLAKHQPNEHQESTINKSEPVDSELVEAQDEGPLKAYVITIDGVSSTVYPPAL